MSRRRIALAVIVAPFIGLALTAGACERRGTVDAPINQGLQDNQAPLIVNEPDGYMNFALKCLGGDLLAAHTRNAAPIIVSGSTACKPGAAEALKIPRVGGVVPSS